MRIYQTQPTMTISVVRKMGYYPGPTLAKRVAQAICYVLEVPEKHVPILRDYLLGDQRAWEWSVHNLTSADYRALLGFSDWYSGEIVQDNPEYQCEPSSIFMDFENIHATYLVANLNSGLSVCFVSNRIRVDSSGFGEELSSAIAERE